MGLFKEHANAFEKVAEKQRRIYSDAADFGFPFNRFGIYPKEISLLIRYVSDLKNTSLIKSRTVWGNPKMDSKEPGGSTVIIEIGWEMDQDDRGMYEIGTRYTISFNKDRDKRMDLCANCNAFISVDIEPYKNYQK